MSTLLPVTAPGSDLMLIARSPLAESNLDQTCAALSSLLKRAGLLSHDS
jgi:RNase P protein component